MQINSAMNAAVWHQHIHVSRKTWHLVTIWPEFLVRFEHSFAWWFVNEACCKDSGSMFVCFLSVDFVVFSYCRGFIDSSQRAETPWSQKISNHKWVFRLLLNPEILLCHWLFQGFSLIPNVKIQSQTWRVCPRGHYKELSFSVKEI